LQGFYAVCLLHIQPGPQGIHIMTNIHACLYQWYRCNETIKLFASPIDNYSCAHTAPLGYATTFYCLSSIILPWNDSSDMIQVTGIAV